MTDDAQSETPSIAQVRPWVRYFARYFDLLLFGFVVGFVAAIAYPDFLTISNTFLGSIILFSYVFVEPIMLTTWGTTPGKALLRTQVRHHNGSNLTYSRALLRSSRVLVFGLGLGFPILTLVALVLSYNKLNKEGITQWDQQGNIVVRHEQIGVWRWSLLVILFLAFLALAVYGIVSSEP